MSLEDEANRLFQELKRELADFQDENLLILNGVEGTYLISLESDKRKLIRNNDGIYYFGMSKDNTHLIGYSQSKKQFIKADFDGTYETLCFAIAQEPSLSPTIDNILFQHPGTQAWYAKFAYESQPRQVAQSEGKCRWLADGGFADLQLTDPQTLTHRFSINSSSWITHHELNIGWGMYATILDNRRILYFDAVKSAWLIHDAPTHHEITLCVLHATPYTITPSLDGRYVAFTFNEDTSAGGVYDTAAGHHRLPMTTNPYTRLSFSPDSRLLYSNQANTQNIRQVNRQLHDLSSGRARPLIIPEEIHEIRPPVWRIR